MQHRLFVEACSSPSKKIASGAFDPLPFLVYGACVNDIFLTVYLSAGIAAWRILALYYIGTATDV